MDAYYPFKDPPMAETNSDLADILRLVQNSIVLASSMLDSHVKHRNGMTPQCCLSVSQLLSMSEKALASLLNTVSDIQLDGMNNDIKEGKLMGPHTWLYRDVKPPKKDTDSEAELIDSETAKAIVQEAFKVDENNQQEDREK
jgi:hypothetical protein